MALIRYDAGMNEGIFVSVQIVVQPASYINCERFLARTIAEPIINLLQMQGNFYAYGLDKRTAPDQNSIHKIRNLNLYTIMAPATSCQKAKVV